MDAVLAHLPYWMINGCLYLLYWLLGHTAELAAIVFALGIAFFLDPAIQRRAGGAPRRYERGSLRLAVPSGTYFTLVVLAGWLAASALSQPPVPAIGAAMWAVGLLSSLAVSEERLNQLWWVKTGLLTYAGLVLLLRFGLQAMEQASPADWAALLGSQADAQLVLDQTTNNLAMLGMLFVLAVYPLGYTAMLVNRFLRNPKPLYNLFREAGEVIQRLRTRSELPEKR